MRIIGIDPGLSHTGWAVVEKTHENSLRIIDSGLINTRAGEDISSRLTHIYDELEQVIHTLKPLHLAIEDTYVNNNFGSSLKLAHARAAAILVGARNKLLVQQYAAKSIKKSITGNGNADKVQVKYMLEVILEGSLGTMKADVSDAIAVAVCHSLLAT